MGFDSINPNGSGSKEKGIGLPLEEFSGDEFDLDEDELKELTSILSSQPGNNSQTTSNLPLKVIPPISSSQNSHHSHRTINSQPLLSSQNSQASSNNVVLESNLTKTETFIDSFDFMSDDSLDDQELEIISRAASSLCSKSRISSSLPTTNTMDGNALSIPKNLSQSEAAKINRDGGENIKADQNTVPFHGNLKRLNSSNIGSSPAKKLDSRGSPNIKPGPGIQVSNSTVSTNQSLPTRKPSANPLDELSEDSDMDDISLDNLFVNQPLHLLKKGESSSPSLINPAASKSNQPVHLNGLHSVPTSTSSLASKRDRDSFLGTSVSNQNLMGNRIYNTNHNVKTEAMIPTYSADSILNPSQKTIPLPQTKGQRWDPKTFGSIFLKSHSKDTKIQPRINSRRLNFTDQLWTESLAPSEMVRV